MRWSTTSDIHAFETAAGEFLAARPVEHSPLLTELDHVRRHPEPDADQGYGWWTDAGGEVQGAFLRAPRHPPLLTPLPDRAVDDLVMAATASPASLRSASRRPRTGPAGSRSRRCPQRMTTHQRPAAIGTRPVSIHHVSSGLLLIARTAAMPTR